MTSDLSLAAAKEPTMTHIGPKPPNEFYRADLDIDCQCARCGSSMGYERCSCDGGTEWIEDEDDEVSDRVCDICDGEGGWHRCMSDPEWCNANPLEGRENVKRGEIEWFTVPEGE